MESARKIRELRESINMSRKEFSNHTGIPIRTLEDWEAGRRTPPEYVPRLISYQLKYEELIQRINTSTDGKTYNVIHYNLDMIISLGYRIKSIIATNFRRWATERLKEYMIICKKNGYFFRCKCFSAHNVSPITLLRVTYKS